MKILHVTNMYPTKNEPHFGCFIKKQIESLGHFSNLEITVYSIKGHGILRYFKSNTISELKILLKQDWDIIHCHFGDTATYIKMFGSNQSAIITSYCGSDVYGDAGVSALRMLKKYVVAKINTRMSRSDFASIAKSQNIAEKLPCDSHIIPNGVDISVFRPIRRDDAIKVLKLESKKTYVLFPGDPKIKRKNYSFISNSINFPDNTEVLTFKHGVDNSLVPFYMAASHCIIFPSLKEGSPNVIKEAMACGRPVISSPVGDLAFLLGGVSHSYIFDLKVEMNEWQSAINKLTKEYLTTNGREMLIEKGLDEKTIAFKLITLYESIVERT